MSRIFGNYLSLFKSGCVSLRKNGFRYTFNATIDVLCKNKMKAICGSGNRKSLFGKNDYAEWIKNYDTIGESDCTEMREACLIFKYKPLMSVLVPVYNTNHLLLRQMIESVINQTYPNWELCIVDDASSDREVWDIIEEYGRNDDRIKASSLSRNMGISGASNEALSMASGEYVVLVDHDDILPSHALFTVCYYINIYDNEVDLLYSDEDKLDSNGDRYNPFFKGGWNRRLFYQMNYIAHLGTYRRSIMNAIGGFRIGFEGSQDYDVALRFIKETKDSRIVHIPHVLYHWRKNPDNDSFSTRHQDISDENAHKALDDYFLGKKEILPCKSLIGCWKIHDKEAKEESLVSIIIPFRDKVELLKNLIDGIINNTNYDAFEIILIDNGSVEKSTIDYLKILKNNSKIKVIRDDGVFNYSRLNNEGAKHSVGNFLLFLNNDILVSSNDWLTNLVYVIQQDNVGAVGARLLYSNNNIQHAGVVTGVYEVAGHPLRHFNVNDVGYFGSTVLERTVSAVTGACLMVKKTIFWQVKGFDEDNLAVSYNDVDLCLKIRNHGYEVVYSPYCTMYHLESQSRGSSVSKETRERENRERHFMIQKYGESLRFDPYYSPILSLSNEDVDLKDPPRVGKPWRDWIEFVCPFHRGDVMIGLQVAYTAAKKGQKVRMHVSREVIDWLSVFPDCDNLKIMPVEIGIPNPEQTGQYYQEAMAKVISREDSSSRIITSRPVRDLEKMGIDLTENMLREIGLSIDTKLLNYAPIDCEKEREIEICKAYGFEPYRTVLIHPNGGWKLKCMSESIVKQIVDVVHECGYKILQIGGEGDKVYEDVDGQIMGNLSLKDWKYLFKSSLTVISVDSWTAHFGSVVNANQVLLYGSTNDRDVGSKRHFVDQSGDVLIFNTVCDNSPCNSFVCRKKRSEYCEGMRINSQLLSDYIKRLKKEL